MRQRIDIPNLATLPDYVAHWADASPHAEATVLGNQRWTYGDLATRIDRLARAMLAAGIVPGDRVATLQTPHPDYLASFLATASIGAIWVGLNPRYQLEELRHVVADAQPKLILSRTELGARDYRGDLSALIECSEGATRVVTFDGDPAFGPAPKLAEFLASGESISAVALSAARAKVDPKDACLIVYTSGSTGKPKGALLSHRGVVAFACAQNSVWPLNPVRALNYFPINHVGCVCDVSAPAIVAGGCLVFLEQFDVHESLRLMERERVTFWASVPSVFQMQLALPDFDRYDLSAVQLIVWEGAAMPRDSIVRLRSICPALATNYGMTETTSAITVTAPTGDVDVLANSVGFAFPGVEVRLVGQNGQPVVRGEEGEVQARSIQNLIGYWNNREATRSAFADDGFFRTGDLAVERPDGRYRLVGRLKEMYKSGGYNVYPREIEAVLEAHSSVDSAAVVGIPDPAWDEVGVAFVTLSAPADGAALLDWCRARLANYKLPKRIVVLNAMPLLPIGKIDKVALKVAAMVK